MAHPLSMDGTQMASWQYLYCILEGTGLPHGTYHGLDGAPVRAITYWDISAVVSSLPQPHVPANARNIRIHLLLQFAGPWPAYSVVTPIERDGETLMPSVCEALGG